jgi:hypothetical protein
MFQGIIGGVKRQEQDVLLEIPEQAARETVKGEDKPKIKPMDRSQGILHTVIVEELVPEDHQVRAIWDLTGRLDLSGFFQTIKSQEGRCGRPGLEFAFVIESLAVCLK